MSDPSQPTTSPTEETVLEPPRTFWAIAKRLGPGLIIAANIVGSGELIATTKTGAQAGISLLWLIIIGCMIKIFVQVELGRFAISHGETTLAALNRIPGPRFRINWVVALWALMVMATLTQLGGIVAGVGQAMAITFPITGDYNDAIQIPSEGALKKYIKWEDDFSNGETEFSTKNEKQQKRIRTGHEALKKQLAAAGEPGEKALATIRAGGSISDPYTKDDRIWAFVAAVLTAGLLYRGRYRFIQNISIVLVVSFTFITIGNVVSLQGTEAYGLAWNDFMHGLSFHLPEATDKGAAIATALATFGIIGVGSTELVAYPYWCLEKGYGRYVGPRTDDEGWANRARGWIRVMWYDSVASMVIYTIATLAFFLMGVVVLYREGRDPDGMRMVSTLATAYVPIFGEYARWLFLAGAIAVLYSTYLIANAGNARMFTDALKVLGFVDKENAETHNRSVTFFSVFLPMLCFVFYLIPNANPAEMVLLGGLMQALMLPVIGMSSIYFRYKMTDKRLNPGWLWDTMLWISFLGFLIAGVWTAYSKISSVM